MDKGGVKFPEGPHRIRISGTPAVYRSCHRNNRILIEHAKDISLKERSSSMNMFVLQSLSRKQQTVFGLPHIFQNKEFKAFSL